jgi:DNA-binding NarL/FixJ family response regulator
VRILIADEEALFRDALRTLVEERGHVVVAEAARSPEAVAAARRSEPDVAVLGLGASRATTLTTVRIITRELPATAVVLLAPGTRADVLPEATRAGARAVLSRDLHGSTFCDMIERVAAGQEAVSPPSGEPERRAANHAMLLTPREREVLGQMAGGRTSNRELAVTLGLSENTVRFHVRNILEKLHLHTRAAAVAHALTRGIVSGGGR